VALIDSLAVQGVVEYVMNLSRRPVIKVAVMRGKPLARDDHDVGKTVIV
jgi:hypothetical protein